MPDEPRPNAPARNLETIALFASLPITNALESAFVIFSADAYFDKYGTAWFRMHPANTLPYTGLRALEGESVVRLAETLRDEHGIHPLDVEIRGKQALLLHRDMASHPLTVQWRRPDRQQFADDGHRWSPFRAGLIWDVRCSLNEALQAQGSEQLADLPIHFGMAATLSTIFTLSMPSNVPVPTAESLLIYLQSQRDRLIQVLEQFPEGR
jgi:hypothetical protein